MSDFNINKTSLKSNLSIAIFCCVSIGCGWIGRLIDSQSGLTGTQTLGTLIWLLSPVICALVLRCLQKNKFNSNRPKNNKFEYIAVSILFYPLIIGLALLIAVLTGNYNLQGFVFKPEIFVGITISALIKNIFEEFAWRGYLTPKLAQIGYKNSTNHAITGTVWGLWHLPYFLFLNPSLRLPSTVDYIAYTIQFLISVIVVSAVYGELRLRTGKIWLGYILHVIVNIITGTLITFSIISTNLNANTFIFSPFDGIIYSIFSILTICGMQKYLYPKHG
jgi:membrane protease YdiL (CAAX protease family)